MNGILMIILGFLNFLPRAESDDACRSKLLRHLKTLNRQASAKAPSAQTLRVEVLAKSKRGRVSAVKWITYFHNGHETYVKTETQEPSKVMTEFYMNSSERVIVLSSAKRIIVDSSSFDFENESKVSGLVGDRMAEYVDSLQNIRCTEDKGTLRVNFEYLPSISRELRVAEMSYQFDVRSSRMKSLYTGYVPSAPYVWQNVEFLPPSFPMPKGSLRNLIFPKGVLRPDIKNFQIVKK